jgi:hypothetical protein
MYDSTNDLLDALRAIPDTLTGLLTGVTQEQARQARGGGENWSVIEILCHLRDAEEYGLQRVTRMRDQEKPEILPWDQEKLAVERSYAFQEQYAVLAEFKSLRRQRIKVLESLPPEGWERSGYHREIGVITIFSHTLHMVSHDAIHCAQIARQLTDG